MSIARSLCGLLPLLLLSTTPSFAQLPSGRDGQTPTEVTLVTESDRVRFTTPGAAVEWRLEVFHPPSQLIFDSGLENSKTLDWPLIDSKGQPIESGFYSYTLTIHRRGSEAQVQRGQLQVDRVRSVYQISALSSDSTPGVILTTTDAGPQPASAPAQTLPSESFRRSLNTVSFAPQPLISGSGTTSSMTKWIDGPSGVVGDTNVTEVNGSVIVGNGTFRGNLQIFGPSDKDVFAGMGPNLITGPGFNFGYAGESFGRSAGFFNVRPDASATPPNPSLRFMTANVERMIITNNGNIGIRTSNPLRTVQIGPSIDAAFTIEESDGSPQAGYIRFGDHTGWQLRISRQRESSGGPLNSGLTGSLVTIRDDGAFFLNSFPLGATGVEPLCRTLGNAITFCQSSSLRYKTDVIPYRTGLAIINRLRPISFAWKIDGTRTIGLAAEEVAAVEPLLTYPNEQGEIEGIRYNQLTPIFINAFKELEAQLERQRKLIRKQQAELEALKRLVCTNHPESALCK